MPLQASQPARIILVEQEGNSHLVSLPAGPQTLTTTKKVIQEIRDPYPSINNIVLMSRDELLVGNPPAVLPAGDACFSCTQSEFIVTPTSTVQIVDLNMDTQIDNSATFSVDVIDSVNKLYRSFLIKAVVKELDVDYNSMKVGDPISNELIFSRSATGIAAHYTNLHSDNVTVILRRI